MVQICGIIAIVLSVFGKFAALFVTIPLPIVGGMFMVMFGKSYQGYDKDRKMGRSTDIQTESYGIYESVSCVCVCD